MFEKKRLLFFISFVSILILNSSYNTPTEGKHCITINFESVRNKKGRIQVQIYRNSESFKAETPWKTRYVSKAELNNGKVTFKIYNIPTGTYGIALLDDENRNAKMDYSWLVPTEGFGFSDYYHTALSKPKFSDFKFNLNSHKSVTMKVRYL
ncbi:MAG: DUF2141 domain-containing protein [Crocinitomicaceae bacterium]|nr:DUF2141 domain-containing protein [Crocinitomicaceae bacterium]